MKPERIPREILLPGRAFSPFSARGRKGASGGTYVGIFCRFVKSIRPSVGFHYVHGATVIMMMVSKMTAARRILVNLARQLFYSLY
jgi:hypothetical protein